MLIYRRAYGGIFCFIVGRGHPLSEISRRGEALRGILTDMNPLDESELRVVYVPIPAVVVSESKFQQLAILLR